MFWHGFLLVVRPRFNAISDEAALIDSFEAFDSEGSPGDDASWS